ncbi:MAG: hypothetical protein IT346_00915 [Epsilonproteobacteria bacterium]|nr:hypothetical protein [Campylobacterota bacterium]
MKSSIKFALVLASLLVIPASQASKLPVNPQVAAAEADRVEAARLVEEARARNAAAAAAIEKQRRENQELQEWEERLKKQNAELQEQLHALRQRTPPCPSFAYSWFLNSQKPERPSFEQQANKQNAGRLQKQGQQPQATLNQSASTSYFTRFKNFWYRLFARPQ